MLLFLLACGSSNPQDIPARPPTADSPVDVQAPDVQFQDEDRVVHASGLHYREIPSEKGQSLGTLDINTRVRLQKSADLWCQIKTPSGQEGWVKCEFLGSSPLTVDGLKQLIASESDPQKKPSLWERLAALTPNDPAVLISLAQSYEAAGAKTKAAQLFDSFGDPEQFFGLWFQSYAPQAADIQTVLAAPKDAQTLLQAWESSLRLCDQISQNLEPWVLDPNDVAQLPPPFEKALTAKLPWMSLQHYAEGTVLIMEPASDPWMAAAQKTASKLDDHFFELLSRSYGSLVTSGWPSWTPRNWDYGGDNIFGSSEAVFVQLLQLTDTILAEPNAPDATKDIRSKILKDAVTASEEFPFSNDMNARRAEAHRILKEIKLSKSEQAPLIQAYGKP